MKNRLNVKKLKDVYNEVVKPESLNGKWVQWDKFEVIESKQGDDAYVIAAENAEYEIYYPLAQVPGLFLEFARLAEEEITREVWLDWIERYGVLGLNRRDPVEDMVEIGFFGEVCLEGGPAESFRHFVGEARKANQALRLYEALSSGGLPDGSVHAGIIPEGDAIENLWRNAPAKTAQARSREVLHAMVGVEIEDSYPTLGYFQREKRFLQGWGFQTLVAAMYLQMMWLLSATGQKVRRCKLPECGKVIDFEQPEQTQSTGLQRNDRSKGYKTRSDKEFCDANCRGYYYYHYVKRREQSGDEPSS